MSEEKVLEEGVLIGNPIKGWKRKVMKVLVKDSDKLEIEIEEGHGLKDVSCRHGSRWIWWYNEKDWVKVVESSDCDCSDPPKPYKTEVNDDVDEFKET